jgi:hypothetical protein
MLPTKGINGGDQAMLALKIFGIRSSTCAMSHMLPDSVANALVLPGLEQ